MNTTRKNTKNSFTTLNNESNFNSLSTVSRNNESDFTYSAKNFRLPKSPESIKISMISLNLASQSDPEAIDNTRIVDCKPDFLVEMTQEDYRPIDAISLFDTSITKDYYRTIVVALNEKQTEQNLVLRIFNRASSSANHTSLDSGKQILKPKGKNNAGYLFQTVATTLRLPKYGYSKGMVWAKVSFDDSSLLFANMHLPMKKKSANLGLVLREKALRLLLRELQTHMDATTTLIIGGDLNFRMNYQGVNQLTTLLQTKFGNLRELPFPDPSQRRYTCKFKPLSKSNSSCEIKRYTAVPSNGNTAEQIAKNLQKECAANDRIPSRCDRFLVSEGFQKEVTVLFQEVLPLDKESDHNALLACINIS